MRKKELGIFGIDTHIGETLATLKLAATTPDIRWLREKLRDEILKTPGPVMQKRTTTEIIRRYVTCDRMSGKVQKTPLVAFASLSIKRNSKVDVLYYQFCKVHPLVPLVFRKLRAEGMKAFNFNELCGLVSVTLCRKLDRNSTGLYTIAYALRDFGLVKKVKPGYFQIVEKILTSEAFIFILYIHFLSHNVIVPKTQEVKSFFKDLYNQNENETEKLLLSAPDGFLSVERNAHLDQALLVYNNMDDFMRKFVGVYGDQR